jgi:CBS domain-containing protein
MRVSELIGGPVSSCTVDTTVLAAAERMIADDVGSLAVVKDESLVGIVTERDIVREFASRESGLRTVGDIMTPNPDSLSPDIDVDDAAAWMMGAGYRHLPVVENGKLVGIVSIKDVLWALTGG